MPKKSAILSAKNVRKNFSGNNILDNISLDIYEGDFTIIMGASGAGKSTLLYALSGMDGIAGGEILFKGEKISGISENKMAKLRATEFGFVFQQTHLVSNLTLFENVATAGYVGKTGKSRDINQIREKAERLLTQMHTDNAKDRLPSQVSGGEAQRAAIARAMINDPTMIFADEPTGALNKANSDEVLNLLTKLNDNGQSILMVTHDVRAAVRGNRILYLEDGHILDELNLSKYTQNEEKDRVEKANQWLSSLRW